MTDSTTHLLRGVALRDAAVVCVVTHGRGQSPEMMVEYVVERLDVKSVAYVLPRAHSGSWYDARAIDALTERTDQQLAVSLELLKHCAGMAPSGVPVVMAGFSQGACLTLEYAFKFGPWKGALVSFTGCRVGISTDARPHSNLSALPVYLSGADQDPWIPIQAHAMAALELASAQCRLRTDVFPGRAHEVSSAEISVLDGLLRQLSSKQEVVW